MTVEMISSYAFPIGYQQGFRPTGSSLMRPNPYLQSATTLFYVGIKMARIPRNTNARSTALASGVGIPLDLGASLDVQIALFTIFCACFSYLLNLFFRELITTNFFTPVYKTAGDLKAEGRPTNSRELAYIYWECMYAVLGLALVTISYIDVFVAPKGRLLVNLQIYAESSEADAAIENLLRDNIIMWALFYVAAFVKIMIESKKLNIINEDRVLFIQVWHFLVASVLFACAATPPYSPFLNTLRNLLHV